mgnify:CR=1 FL=1
MTINIKIATIIYIVVIMHGVSIVTLLLLKAKRSRVLYNLLTCHIAIILWMFLAIIENFAINSSFFNIAVRLTLLPIMLIGSLLFIFLLNFTGVIREKSKLVTLLILLPSILCYLPLLFRNSELVIKETIKNHSVIRWGVMFYVNLAITHSYIIIGLSILLYKSIKKNHQIKQSIILSVSILMPGIFNILTGAKVIGSPGFDLVPITFTVTLTLVSILIYKYKIVDIIPLASYELFNFINSAALVVDIEGNIDEYNCTFENYFKQILDIKDCKDIYSFVALLDRHSDDKQTIKDLIDAINKDDNQTYEITIRTQETSDLIKQYMISIVPINALDNSMVGKLMIIKDVTDYRISTIAEERTRLSDDLHDSLGNCINIISSNLEYAINNIERQPEIKECLEISYNKAASAFLHLRRIVEELKPIDIENNGLLWALKSLFSKLQTKGIHIEFSHKDLDDKWISARKHGEVIYFLCQEAINNAIIHGKASNITIILNQTGKQLRIYISDDGSGCKNIVRNKGINSMESRIQSLGGTFECGSPSEGGFNIRVLIPLYGLTEHIDKEVADD